MQFIEVPINCPHKKVNELGFRTNSRVKCHLKPDMK